MKRIFGLIPLIFITAVLRPAQPSAAPSKESTQPSITLLISLALDNAKKIFAFENEIHANAEKEAIKPSVRKVMEVLTILPKELRSIVAEYGYPQVPYLPSLSQLVAAAVPDELKSRITSTSIAQYALLNGIESRWPGFMDKNFDALSKKLLHGVTPLVGSTAFGFLQADDPKYCITGFVRNIDSLVCPDCGYYAPEYDARWINRYSWHAKKCPSRKPAPMLNATLRNYLGAMLVEHAFSDHNERLLFQQHLAINAILAGNLLNGEEGTKEAIQLARILTAEAELYVPHLYVKLHELNSKASAQLPSQAASSASTASTASAAQ